MCPPFKCHGCWYAQDYLSFFFFTIWEVSEITMFTCVALVSAAVSQQGRGLDSGSGAFLCGVHVLKVPVWVLTGLSSFLPLWGLCPVTPASSHSPKTRTCDQLGTLNCVSVNGCFSRYVALWWTGRWSECHPAVSSWQLGETQAQNPATPSGRRKWV